MLHCIYCSTPQYLLLISDVLYIHMIYDVFMCSTINIDCDVSVWCVCVLSKQIQVSWFLQFYLIVFSHPTYGRL